MKAYVGAKVTLHKLLTSTMNGHKWSTSNPDRRKPATGFLNSYRVYVEWVWG